MYTCTFFIASIICTRYYAYAHVLKRIKKCGTVYCLKKNIHGHSFSVFLLFCVSPFLSYQLTLIEASLWPMRCQGTPKYSGLTVVGCEIQALLGEYTIGCGLSLTIPSADAALSTDDLRTGALWEIAGAWKQYKEFLLRLKANTLTRRDWNVFGENSSKSRCLAPQTLTHYSHGVSR